MKKLLTQNGFELTYFCFGNGSKCLVCFPGFGRSAREYRLLDGLLPDTRLICIDYFFTDPSSVYPADRIERKQLEKDEYADLINALLKNEGVIGEFDILCYSMGARLAMCFAENQPNARRLFLMAPDGVKISRWHRISGSRIGKRLYKALVLKRPVTFFRTIRLLRKFRILSRSMVKFLEYHLSSKEKRLLVFNTWLSSKNLIPDHKRLSETGIEFFLFIGRYDRVITKAIIPIFKSNISGDVHVDMLECGHDMINMNTFKQVAMVISQKKPQ